ncbi:uncharacterized protein V1510DRAFT_358737, partial [Dipodascopsis tothii]|uniref:uncharacterized protein n=1 Tax=Dipodascopsis tothii TaxID=44089 RepID=UPI0034CD8110
SVEVIYSASAVFNAAIVLRLPAFGLRLHFDPCRQYLQLIELVDFSKTKVSYRSQEIVYSGVPLFKTLYKTFGPTYPGRFDIATHTYVLSYPGLAFSFYLPESEFPNFQATKAEDFVSILWNSGVCCSSMAILKGTYWPPANHEALQASRLSNSRPKSLSSRPASEFARAYYLIQPSCTGIWASFYPYYTPQELTINDPPDIVAKSNNAMQTSGRTREEIVLGHTTMQDTMLLLGVPSETYNKHDSRLSIHRLPHKQDDSLGATDDDACAIFFNYFGHGIDVLFSAETHTAQKLVLHGNLPGTYLFQKYQRCRWTILQDSVEHSSLDMHTPSAVVFASSEDYIATPSHSLKGPMIINRTLNSPSSSVEFVDFDDQTSNDNAKGFETTELWGRNNLIFEVTKQGAISSLTLF